MHIQEISDEVTEHLKLGDSPEHKMEGDNASKPESSSATAATTTASSPSQSQDVSASVPATATGAIFPELSPGRAMTENKTIDEVVAELKRSPFFMTELEENDETEAFKALAYEGTPLENASEFKEQGNECFQARRWADAKEFYTKGVLILAAEERKRRNPAAAAAAAAAVTKPEKSSSKDEEGEKRKDSRAEEKTETSEDEIRQELTTLISLYVNRAACHLELKNYRSCWLDGSAALRLNPTNIKAYYRSAKAFLAVGRIAEADDACARGLELDPSNKSLQAVAQEVIKKATELSAREKRESERVAKEKRRTQLVRAALVARGIRTRKTAQPPEMEDAGVHLVPDPDEPASHLCFPTVLLYPLHLQSDFIKAFHETNSLADHLADVFPLPWDERGEYTASGVECYLETVTGGLVKVGKKVSLLKILAGGKVEVVDEVVRIFVLPTARAAAWVEEFKMKKAAEKGVR